MIKLNFIFFRLNEVSNLEDYDYESDDDLNLEDEDSKSNNYYKNIKIKQFFLFQTIIWGLFI